MYLKVADIVQNKGRQEIQVLEDISQQVIDSLFKSIKPGTNYRHVRNLYDIVVSNGNDLIIFLERLSRPGIEYKKKVSSSTLIEANKKVANYCSSLSMFIEQTKKTLPKTEMRKSFHFECQEMYDNNFEYRFFVKLRNYIMHYSLPFNVRTEDESGQYVWMSKQDLLQFNKWGIPLKYDLKKLDEKIDILSWITPMNQNVEFLFWQFIYIYRNEIVRACESASHFIKKYQFRGTPAVVRFRSRDDLYKPNISMTPIDFSDLRGALCYVKQHPNIKFEEKSV